MVKVPRIFTTAAKVDGGVAREPAWGHEGVGRPG